MIPRLKEKILLQNILQRTNENNVNEIIIIMNIITIIITIIFINVKNKKKKKTTDSSNLVGDNQSRSRILLRFF